MDLKDSLEGGDGLQGEVADPSSFSITCHLRKSGGQRKWKQKKTLKAGKHALAFQLPLGCKAPGTRVSHRVLPTALSSRFLSEAPTRSRNDSHLAHHYCFLCTYCVQNHRQPLIFNSDKQSVDRKALRDSGVQ